MNEIKAIFYKDFENAHIPEILKEMYIDFVYKDQVERLNRTDLTIIDAGSNIGMFSHYAYPFAKKIYAIEPTAAHVEVLTRMLKFNGMDDKVTVIQKALGNENKMTTFYHSINSTANSLNPALNSKNETEEVEVITMDTLFTQNNIKHVDFMKLDVEGEESNIINGAGFEQVADKIDSMVIEYHTWSGVNPNLMLTALRDYGFQVWTIPHNATLFGAKR